MTRVTIGLLACVCAVGCRSGGDARMVESTHTMEPCMTLQRYVESRLAETPPPERRERLEELARAIAQAPSQPLVFICTHNSRRSQLAQVWARAAAARFGFDELRTHSGGTEATAFHANAVAALERAGFAVGRGDEERNPTQTVVGGDGVRVSCWSKTFGDPANPQRGFTAVMTCAEADEACPFVPGAAARISLPYVDPKVADGTPDAARVYDERCAQIAREMLWVMRRASELRG